MTTRFKNAYDALIKAFFEGTLAKGTCAACAVGNIVGAAMGVKSVIHKTHEEYWNNFMNCKNTVWSHDFEANKIDALIGYSLNEVNEIESAFECNTEINFNYYGIYSESQILNDQFNGLMAVVDVLLELDNMKDEGYKESFKAHPKLVLIEN